MIQLSYDPDKAIAAVVLLASKGLPELTKGKICKLFFLADLLHLVRYGRTVTGDCYAAMEHGPVPSKTLNALDVVEAGNPVSAETRSLDSLVNLDRRYQYPRYASTKEAFSRECFSKSDLLVLEEVIVKYGQMTFNQLRAITHDHPAYKSAWERRGNTARERMDFEAFFDGENGENPDAIAGVKEEFLENAAIQRPCLKVNEPSLIAPFSVIRIPFNFGSGAFIPKLFVVLGHSESEAYCVKVTSQTQAYDTDPERMSGVVCYETGEIDFFRKLTIVEPHDQFDVRHYQLSVYAS